MSRKGVRKIHAKLCSAIDKFWYANARAGHTRRDVFRSRVWCFAVQGESPREGCASLVRQKHFPHQVAYQQSVPRLVPLGAIAQHFPDPSHLSSAPSICTLRCRRGSAFYNHGGTATLKSHSFFRTHSGDSDLHVFVGGGLP